VLACAITCAMSAIAGEPEETQPDVIKRVITIQTNPDERGLSASQQRGALFTLDVTERPLKQVLDYLSTISNINIRVVKEKDNKLPVSFRLENVTTAPCWISLRASTA